MQYKNLAIDLKNKVTEVAKPLEWKVNRKSMIERMIENMFNREFNK